MTLAGNSDGSADSASSTVAVASSCSLSEPAAAPSRKRKAPDGTKTASASASSASIGPPWKEDWQERFTYARLTRIVKHYNALTRRLVIVSCVPPFYVVGKIRAPKDTPDQAEGIAKIGIRSSIWARAELERIPEVYVLLWWPNLNLLAPTAAGPGGRSLQVVEDDWRQWTRHTGQARLSAKANSGSGPAPHQDRPVRYHNLAEFLPNATPLQQAYIRDAVCQRSCDAAAAEYNLCVLQDSWFAEAANVHTVIPLEEMGSRGLVPPRCEKAGRGAMVFFEASAADSGATSYHSQHISRLLSANLDGSAAASCSSSASWSDSASSSASSSAGSAAAAAASFPAAAAPPSWVRATLLSAGIDPAAVASDAAREKLAGLAREFGFTRNPAVLQGWEDQLQRKLSGAAATSTGTWAHEQQEEVAAAVLAQVVHPPCSVSAASPARLLQLASHADSEVPLDGHRADGTCMHDEHTSGLGLGSAMDHHHQAMETILCQYVNGEHPPLSPPPRWLSPVPDDQSVQQYGLFPLLSPCSAALVPSPPQHAAFSYPLPFDLSAAASPRQLEHPDSLLEMQEDNCRPQQQQQQQQQQPPQALSPVVPRSTRQLQF